MNPDIPIDGTPEAPAAPNETSGSAATAGALLRGLRQKHGLARESLATALHVPITKLAALEEDRPEDLPDAVFARALALAICRHLHEDPKPILAALPQLDANPLRDHNARGLDTPLQRPHLRPSQRAPSHETAHRGTASWAWRSWAACCCSQAWRCSGRVRRARSSSVRPQRARHRPPVRRRPQAGQLPPASRLRRRRPLTPWSCPWKPRPVSPTRRLAPRWWCNPFTRRA